MANKTRNCGVYKITNPVGQIYIGASSDLHQRLKKYKYLNQIISQSRLYQSFKKYGYDNHIIIILKRCSKIQLSFYEKFFTDKYNCFNNKNSLNLREGGGVAGKWCNESKKKVSGENNHFYGRKHSKKSIRKAAEKQMGVLSKKAKKVKQILKNGKTIKTWGCMADAARALKMSRADIVNVCKGNKKSAGGYYWEYA